MARIDLQPQRLDVSMVRGDTLRLVLDITEQDSGQPLDMTGMQVFASARPVDVVGGAAVAMQVVVAGSEVTLFMPSADTRQLGARSQWDVSLVSGQDSRTVVFGVISLQAEVSVG